MNSNTLKWLCICLVFSLNGILFAKTANALPRLDFPPPNIFIYSFPAPEFDSESGLVKGEIVLKNTGGNYIGAFPISVWIEGLESQTKVSVWVNNMSGYGYTRSFSYHFNCNTGMYILNRSYWVMAKIDNGTSLRSNGSFQYSTPDYYKPNLTFDFSDQEANGYVFDSVTNEISFSNAIINKGTWEADLFTVTWYFSEDETIDTNDFEIGSYTISEGLSALSPSYALSDVTFDLDNLSGLTPGNYYVGIIIDSNEDVAESWEDDNTSYFSGFFVWGGATGPANLTFSTIETEHSWSYNTTTHELYLRNTIENTGSFQSGEFRVRRYLYSSDVGYILYDSEIIEELLPSGKQPLINTVDLDEISGLPNGSYSIVVFIDDQEVIDETDETDNFGSFVAEGDSMFVYNNSLKANLGFYSNSDQGIYNSMAYYPENHFIYFRSGIGNYGQTAAPSFKVGYYLSEDTVIDPNEDYFLFYWLLPNGLLGGSASGSDIITRSLDVYAPDLPVGTYYFGMYIDPEFAVDEYDELLSDNSAYFGDLSQIIEWTGPYCDGDFEPDGDVDGSDLEVFITEYSAGSYQAEHIPIFTQNFGKNNCATLPVGTESAQQSTSSVIPAETVNSQLLGEVSSNLELSVQTVLQTKEPLIVSTASKEADMSWPLIEDYAPSSETVQAETQEKERTPDEFVIKEISWSASNNQDGVVSGELEWQINEINLELGTNIINLIVTDALGNIAEKEIQVVYNEILTEDGTTRLPEQWTRRLTYEFNFDETDSEDTTITAADVTIWLWPDKIIMTDDYLNSDDLGSNRITTEDGFQYHWSMECDGLNKKILYLDLPSELL